MKQPALRALFENAEPALSPGWDPQAPLDAVAWQPLCDTLVDVDARAGAPQAPTLSAAETVAAIREACRQEVEAVRTALGQERARYAAAAKQLEDIQARFVEEAEEEIAGLALHIAEQVIVQDMWVRGDFVKRMANAAVGAMQGARHITLRVSPDDAPMLHEALNALPVSGERHLDVREDATLVSGGLVATCEGARFDADIKARVDAIGRALAAASKEARGA